MLPLDLDKHVSSYGAFRIDGTGRVRAAPHLPLNRGTRTVGHQRWLPWQLGQLRSAGGSMLHICFDALPLHVQPLFCRPWPATRTTSRPPQPQPHAPALATAYARNHRRATTFTSPKIIMAYKTALLLCAVACLGGVRAAPCPHAFANAPLNFALVMFLQRRASQQGSQGLPSQQRC